MGLSFRLRMISVGLLGDKEGRGMYQGGRCQLCDEEVAGNISCTVESLLVIEEDTSDLKGLKSEWQNGETKVMKVE